MTPEWNLWRDVVHSLIEDFQKETKGLSDPDELDRVYSRLNFETYSKDFGWCCDWIDVHPDYIRKQLKALYDSTRKVVLIRHQNHLSQRLSVVVTKETLLESHGFSSEQSCVEHDEGCQLQFQNIL